MKNLTEQLAHQIIMTEEKVERQISNLRGELRQYTRNGETEWAHETEIELNAAKAWLKTLRTFANY